jgi:hypothetical protein
MAPKLYKSACEMGRKFIENASNVLSQFKVKMLAEAVKKDGGQGDIAWAGARQLLGGCPKKENLEGFSAAPQFHM